MTHADHHSELHAKDLEDLRDLLAACLEHDGALPAALDAALVRHAFLSGPGIGARGVGGHLIAAAALGQPNQGVVPASGAVHPAHRGRGIGASLLRWSLREANGNRVQLRSEFLTAEFEDLAILFGFTKVFCEFVMRRPSQPPIVPIPITGFATKSWSVATVHAFFEAYIASFAERPGFPGWSQQQWAEQMASGNEFRPDSSMVVFDPSGQPIGFVLVDGPWIEQIGVAPAWRRRGIARGLLNHAIEQVAAGGSDAAWLNVNEDNPAAISLYEGVGFTRFGRRGRFEHTAST